MIYIYTAWYIYIYDGAFERSCCDPVLASHVSEACADCQLRCARSPPMDPDQNEQLLVHAKLWGLCKPVWIALRLITAWIIRSESICWPINYEQVEWVNKYVMVTFTANASLSIGVSCKKQIIAWIYFNEKCISAKTSLNYNTATRINLESSVKIITVIILLGYEVARVFDD